LEYPQFLGESADESRLATVEIPFLMGHGDDSGQVVSGEGRFLEVPLLEVPLLEVPLLEVHF
jgi:hypothetical protein